MKTYKVTIEFTTDAPASEVHEIAGNMVEELEPLQDAYLRVVDDTTMEVEEVKDDPIVQAILTKH